MPPIEQPPADQAGVERIPTMQRILDNPFLLLFLGVTLPTVLYLILSLIHISEPTRPY